MFVWPCIIDINNVEDHLDTKITIYWYSNRLNIFRTIFCPSSGAQDCVLHHVVCSPICCRSVVWNTEALTMCSVWRILTGGLERGGTDCVFGVKDVDRWSGTRRHWLCVECEGCCSTSLKQHPSHRTHSQFLRVPDHRPATSWVALYHIL